MKTVNSLNLKFLPERKLKCARLVLMRNFLHSIIFLILLFAVFAFFYFYIPESIIELNQKITNSDPTVTNQSRLNLVDNFGKLLLKGLPNSTIRLYHYWFCDQRKITDLRIKNAISEIKNTTVPPGKIKIWSMLNMGVVLKTDKNTVAVDTANFFLSSAHDELVDLVDIFLVTHADLDHFDAVLLVKASKKGKKIVLPEGLYLEKTDPKNILTIKTGQTINQDGIKITAYQTDHRGDGNFVEPGLWYVFEVGNYKILHTGDGRDFKNENEKQKVYSMKNIDILLANIMIHPYNIRDLSPKIYFPLHLYKFTDQTDLYQESMIEEVKEKNQKYAEALKRIKIIYLLPGESFIYPF